jgi:hypothetical protein
MSFQCRRSINWYPPRPLRGPPPCRGGSRSPCGAVPAADPSGQVFRYSGVQVFRCSDVQAEPVPEDPNA